MATESTEPTEKFLMKVKSSLSFPRKPGGLMSACDPLRYTQKQFIDLSVDSVAIRGLS